MPASTEIAFYQLGIRLTQCRELHRRCTSPWNPNTDAAPPSSQGFALTKEGFLLLERALAEFADANNLPASLYRVLKSHVRACRLLWKQWARVPSAQLNDGEIDTSEHDQNLDALEDHVKSQIGKLAEERRRLDWFFLGKEICRYRREDPAEYTDRCVLNKEQIFERARTRPKPKWVLSISREASAIIKRIGITLDVLLPEVTRAPAIICLLPYNPTQYWPWFRVEAGLRALLGPAKSPSTQPEAASAEDQSSATPTGEPPKHGPAAEEQVRWDSDLRQLWVGNKCIRAYRKHPAPSQTAILNAFQAADWSRKVESPIPSDNLNQTLRQLNKGLRPKLITFRADGTGSGIYWERGPESAST